MNAVKNKHKIVPSRVAILSEIGCDLDIYNPKANETLFKFLEADQALTSIIVDGLWTRLDRPEIMHDFLTYWNKTEEECDEATDMIPNHEQFQWMLDKQLNMAREWLKSLIKHNSRAQIILYIATDDTQFSTTAVLNEMLILRKTKLSNSLKKLGSSQKNTNSELREIRKRYSKLQGAKGASKERHSLRRKIQTRERRLEKIRDSIDEQSHTLQLFREKKVRPAHQHTTEKYIKEIFSKYSALSDELGITLVTRPSVLKFGDMVVKFSHSGHHKWTVLKSRDNRLVLSMHGKDTTIDTRDIIEFLATTPENEPVEIEEVGLADIINDDELLNSTQQKTMREDIDVILEGGHHGIGFKQLQKMSDDTNETNFQYQTSYAPNLDGKHVTFMMATPFEDQERIDKYRKGKKPARMSGGIPMNTRSSEIFNRANNDSVSGLSILCQNEEGLIHTEWIQYQNFLDGSVLNQPKDYSVVYMTSDEHKGSPEEILSAQDGIYKIYRDNATTPFSFRGKPAYARCFISGGDTGEANSRKWVHRYHRRPDPTWLMKQIIKDLSAIDNNDVDQVVKTALRFMDYALAGPVESMRDILQRVANYYMMFFEISLKHSPLRWLHLSVPGNHADGVLQDLGLRESDFFVERLETRNIPVFEVGISSSNKQLPPSDARVAIGGYSSARILNIKDFGLSVEGNVMFGPVNLLLQHDPKGSGFSGIIGAGKNAKADVTLAGHTHENRLKLYKTGHNTFSVAYRMSTMQGVTPTEKSYASSVPRTQGAHWIITPMRGDFAEMAIPINHLNEVGMVHIHEQVCNALDAREQEKTKP